MAKIRVFQLASELNYDKNKLVTLCKESGLEVKSPLSAVDEDLANKIKELVKTKEVKPATTDGVIRTMKDLPSISSDDLERGKIRLKDGSSSSSSSSSTSTSTSKVISSTEPRKDGASKAAPKKASADKSSKEKDAKTDMSQERAPQRSSEGSDTYTGPPRTPRKKVAMTEFERQQAKIAKRKKQKEKATARAERRLEKLEQEKIDAKTIRIGDGATPAELAESMTVNASDLIATLFGMGIMASINQKLDVDTCTILVEEYGFSVDEDVEEDDVIDLDYEDAEEDMQPRDAIVTVMGHVDHGKTTLLDYIRRAQVADGEAGGITQHIGAYKVSTQSGHQICFLDTPGHEAFTAMRAHGSQITDIAILVVAADDSVKPQTLEAINHAKNADVPIIVAITKMDKQGANLQKVYEDLGANGLIVEQWGGTIPSQGVSGISGEGVDDLLELVAIQADLMELKTNPDREGVGVIVEAGMHKGRGSVATVLVQKGTVEIGDIMVAGTSMGRVRSMTNDHGKRVKTAGPSTPVEITGWDSVPQFADRFFVVDNEKTARQVVSHREILAKDLKSKAQQQGVSLETLFAKVEEGKLKELKVIVKADVHGSVIALSEALEKIQEEDVRVKVVHSGVGAVSESDIMLASAAEAIIICFHVRADSKIQLLADEHKVDVRMYRIIYEAIEEIESAIKGMLTPKFKEVVLGKATIREVFSIGKVGKIAGSFVDSGKIVRGKDARLIRDGIEVYVGKVDTVNRFKESVTEVLSGYECGINIKYNDIKESDIIEVFEMQEIPRD